jgi:hypothetical protein
VKLNDLKNFPPSYKLSHLLSLQRITPEYGTNICHRYSYWDGILSGILRWNGGLFYFHCILDEMDFALPVSSNPHDSGIGFEHTSDGTRRYYAVCLYSTAKMIDMVRTAVSHRRYVNPRGDYRYMARHNLSESTLLSKKNDRPSWSNRNLRKVREEPYDGEVIAWFTL